MCHDDIERLIYVTSRPDSLRTSFPASNCLPNVRNDFLYHMKVVLVTIAHCLEDAKLMVPVPLDEHELPFRFRAQMPTAAWLLNHVIR